MGNFLSFFSFVKYLGKLFILQKGLQNNKDFSIAFTVRLLLAEFSLIVGALEVEYYQNALDSY